MSVVKEDNADQIVHTIHASSAIGTIAITSSNLLFILLSSFLLLKGASHPFVVGVEPNALIFIKVDQSHAAKKSMLLEQAIPLNTLSIVREPSTIVIVRHPRHFACAQKE